MSESGGSSTAGSKRQDIRKIARKLNHDNKKLRREIRNLELVFRNAVDVLIMADAESGRIQRISDAAESVLGFKRDELAGKPLTELLPVSGKGIDDQGIPQIVDGVVIDRRVNCSDGSDIFMDMTMCLVDDESSPTILITLRDTSERRRCQYEMMKKNGALDRALSAMVISDNSWRLDYANMEALNYWRYERGDILHLELPDLFSFIGDFDTMQEILEEKGQWEGEVECIRRDSTTFYAHATAVRIDSEEDIETCFVLSFLDITKRVELEKKLTELSLHDSLTGLYNRRGFMTLGRQMIDSSRRKQPEVGLLYLDIDGLKQINDDFGHRQGDKALELTAKVLRNCFRESDIIARLGGDEFVVLFMDSTGFTENSIRERIRGQIEELVPASGLETELSLSMGYFSTVLSYQTHIGQLLSQADGLMYSNKESSKEDVISSDDDPDDFSEDDILI